MNDIINQNDNLLNNSSYEEELIYYTPSNERSDKIIPIRVDKNGAIISGYSLVHGVMLYPDLKNGNNKEIATLIASEYVYTREKRLTTKKELFTFPINLLDIRDNAIGFLFKNKEDIENRAEMGRVAGQMMISLRFFRSARESMIADAINDIHRKSSIENERKYQIGLDKLMKYVYEGLKNQDPLNHYGRDFIRESWNLMKPVAHFWAAVIELEEYSEKLWGDETEEEQLDDERLARKFHIFLYIAKRLYHQTHNHFPHGSSEPLFDKNKAYWIDKEIDNWLMKTEGDFLTLPKDIRASLINDFDMKIKRKSSSRKSLEDNAL